eukprot:654154-Amphidinium_carterae.3
MTPSYSCLGQSLLYSVLGVYPHMCFLSRFSDRDQITQLIPLIEVCDGDLAQIASFKRQRRLDESILAAIDESFWTELKVTKTGHKLLLAKAIDELAQG